MMGRTLTQHAVPVTFGLRAGQGQVHPAAREHDGRRSLTVEDGEVKRDNARDHVRGSVPAHRLEGGELLFPLVVRRVEGLVDDEGAAGDGRLV